MYVTISNWAMSQLSNLTVSNIKAKTGSPVPLVCSMLPAEHPNKLILAELVFGGRKGRRKKWRNESRVQEERKTQDDFFPFSSSLCFLGLRTEDCSNVCECQQGGWCLCKPADLKRSSEILEIHQPDGQRGRLLAAQPYSVRLWMQKGVLAGERCLLGINKSSAECDVLTYQIWLLCLSSAPMRELWEDFS